MDVSSDLESLYRAKAQRRKALIALSVDEKVKIIERLRQFGLSMRKLRRVPPVRYKQIVLSIAG